jgi:hypothetical protein
VQIAVYGGGTSVTVGAATAVAPIANVTEILWWSRHDMAFHRRRVTAQSGTAGAWLLTLDAPLVDSMNNVASVGDFISPAAVNAESYAKTWRSVMRSMGPGEMLSPGSNRLPRASRHPKPTAKWPSALTIVQLNTFTSAHKEVSDCAWSYRSATEPTVPGSVDLPPNILVPNNFGIYPA